MFSMNAGMPEASTEDKLIQRKYNTKGTFDCLKILHHEKFLMIMLLANESAVVISKIPFRSATRAIHKHTLLALLPTFYSRIFIVFFLKILVNVKLDVIGLRFRVENFIGLVHF